MPVTLPPMHRDVTSDAAERAWQHWVPEAYLRQWRDPATPQGAYVWVCPKDGSAPPRRQSPKRTFASKDMNTMTRDGLRNLRLESVYHAMETGFGAVRAKITAGEPATDADPGGVVHFVAAQIVRTPKFRDSWRFAATEDHAAQLAEIADPAARAAVGRVLADVAANQPQILCLAAFPRILELLGNMRVLLLKAAVPRAFLTSDSPCCVIDRKDAGERCSRPSRRRPRTFSCPSARTSRLFLTTRTGRTRWCRFPGPYLLRGHQRDDPGGSQQGSRAAGRNLAGEMAGSGRSGRDGSLFRPLSPPGAGRARHLPADVQPAAHRSRRTQPPSEVPRLIGGLGKHLGGDPKSEKLGTGLRFQVGERQTRGRRLRQVSLGKPAKPTRHLAAPPRWRPARLRERRHALREEPCFRYLGDQGWPPRTFA